MTVLHDSSLAKWMQAGKPSRYVARHQGQLSLLPSVGW